MRTALALLTLGLSACSAPLGGGAEPDADCAANPDDADCADTGAPTDGSGGDGDGSGGDDGSDGGDGDTGVGDGGDGSDGTDGGDGTDGSDGDDGSASGSGGSGGPVGTGAASVGAVSYAYHVPSCVVDTTPAPVLFTQHGSGGTGSGMVDQWRALADAECFIVIGQGSQSGEGWNFGSDVEGLGQLIDEVDRLWNIDTDRRVLHGYSAGAHWGYVIGLANSATFGGLIVYAGAMAYADSTGVWPGGTQGPIPVAIGHGTDDTVVPYAYAEQAEDRLTAAGWPVDLWTVSGGSHAYDADHQAVAWAFVMDRID